MTHSKPAIVVIAYNRPRSFVRLLASIAKADFPRGSDVPLVLSIDRSDSDEVSEIARGFAWSHGEKRVIVHEDHLGWKHHVLTVGDLSWEYGSILLLEDDLYVSPQFYDYSIKALDFYSDDLSVAGVSLYSMRVNEYTALRVPFCPLEDGSDVFFLQKGIPWGTGFSNVQWELFREWFADGTRQVSPHDDLPSRVISWPETSLSKLFIKYLAQCNRFFVHPRVSLSTNFGEPGLHNRDTDRSFQAPLQVSARDWKFIGFEDSVAVYDSFYELLPDRLNRMSNLLRGYNYCTDLYGTRSLGKTHNEYILTTRAPTTHIFSFPMELVPMELNVIDNLEGTGIWFCESRSVQETPEGDIRAAQKLGAFFYPDVLSKNRGFADLVRLKRDCLAKEEEIGRLYSEIRFLEGKLAWSLPVGSFIGTRVRSVRNVMKGLGRALLKKDGRWVRGGRFIRSIRPRLGVLNQYSPRPVHMPSHYTDADFPSASPTVSLVTPSFNQARFVERTIRSVLDQNYPALEYIIQDGGSSDETTEILGRYGAQITHWESTPDRGQAHAVNRGFDRSTGEIMGYLNSDDLLLPGAINYVARFFSEHPRVDVVYGHRIVIDENDMEIGRWVMPPHDVQALGWIDYIPQETLFWRRRIWSKTGGALNENLRYIMDWDLILRFSDDGAQFARLPRFLGAFRVHPRQKTSVSMSNACRKEVESLRRRRHGAPVSEREALRACRNYLFLHLVYHYLYVAGLTDY